MNFKEVGKDVPLPRYNCPMVDIDLLGNDLEHVTGIASWQECGMSHKKSNCLIGHCPFHKIINYEIVVLAHICNIVHESNCKFWTWSGYDGSAPHERCLLKSSAGLHKLWYPTIRDTSMWSKFGAHGEHGDVFLFSNKRCALIL